MRFPFAISVPHCSYNIPPEIRPTLALTQREILESTDLGTRELFTNLPVRVTLWARWSRLVSISIAGATAHQGRSLITEGDSDAHGGPNRTKALACR